MNTVDKQSAFLTALAEALESKTPLGIPTRLEDYAWDSLAHVLVIGIVDEIYGKQLDGEALARCETVGEILALAEAP